MQSITNQLSNLRIQPDDTKIHENLLDHVLLPRYLSSEKLTHFHEVTLLSYMIETLKDFSDSPPNTLKMFESLARVHRQRSAEIISKEINELQPGNTFAMFVRRQNCCFMVHMPITNVQIKPNDETTVIVSTFPGSIHPREIYGNPSDLEV